MKVFLNLAFLCLIFVLSSRRTILHWQKKILILKFVYLVGSYKISFDNGNSMLKLESNKIVNGKPVGEPNPEEAIGISSK